MPWTRLKAKPSRWPFPNREFDPERGFAEYEKYIEQFRLASESGFDWLGFGEEHMSAYSIIPNANLLAARLCGETKDSKIAALGNAIPLLNPLRVAEEYAMLDVMSNGRLVAGFLRGYPQNYHAYGVNPDESWERFIEGTALIKKAWTSPAPFTWKRRHYRFDDVSIWPRPLQKPHPAIVFSGSSRESAVFAARQKGIMANIHVYQWDAINLIQDRIKDYRAEAAKSGWTPGPQNFMVGFQTCIADTNRQAKKILEDGLAYVCSRLTGVFDKERRSISARTSYGGPMPRRTNARPQSNKLENPTVFCGDPDTVTRQIAEVARSTGAGIISLQFQVGNIPHESVCRGIELFKQHVRPALPKNFDDVAKRINC